MNTMLARLLLPLAAAMSCCAPAAASDTATGATPGATIDLTGLRLQLVSSVDGSALPLSFRFDGFDVSTRVYTEQTMAQDIADEPDFRPIAGQATLGPGHASITLDQPFGDMHVAVGFSDSTPDWSTADVTYHTNGEFSLPAHSVLTISGHFSLAENADWQRNHGYYELGLIGASDGVTGGRFLYESVDPEETDFAITATNRGDAPATVYQYSDTYASAFATVAAPVPAPVPELPAPAMLGAGMALLAARAAHARKKGGRGLPS